MRSGLQTPSAVPLLAILVAALSSMTPVVCEAWMRPSVFLGRQGYRDVLADDSVMAMRASNLPLPGDDMTSHSNMSALDLISPLLPPMQMQKDGLDQLSIASPPFGAAGVVSSPEQERAWWQQACRVSPIESPSSANASSSASFRSPLSSRRTNLAKLSDPTRNSETKVFPAAKNYQSAVENSSSSLHSSPVDSSGPIERNGSFLAVMVSLVVAIMWF